MDDAKWVIGLPQPKTQRLRLDESVAKWPLEGSRDRILAQRANHRSGVHDVRWINGGLDTAHRSDAAHVAVPLQKMLLEPADAVLRAKRATERRGRVVELQRQAAFDPLGKLYPVDVGRHQHVVMQIAIADVSIDGQLEIRVIRPYLRPG